MVSNLLSCGFVGFGSVVLFAGVVLALCLIFCSGPRGAVFSLRSLWQGLFSADLLAAVLVWVGVPAAFGGAVYSSRRCGKKWS